MRIPQILRFVFLFGLVGGFCAAAEMPGLKVGDRAPEFTLASGTLVENNAYGEHAH
jgi:hypothetical protein